ALLAIYTRLIWSTRINAEVIQRFAEVDTPICLCDKSGNNFIPQVSAGNDLELFQAVVALLHLFDKVETRRALFEFSGIGILYTCIRIGNERVKHRVVYVVACFRGEEICFGISD